MNEFPTLVHADLILMSTKKDLEGFLKVFLSKNSKAYRIGISLTNNPVASVIA